MQALKARVVNGRYVIDEPAQLPEGAAVELVVVAGDELTEKDRAALHASLDRALDDEDAGRFVDGHQFMTEVLCEGEPRAGVDGANIQCALPPRPLVHEGRRVL